MSHLTRVCLVVAAVFVVIGEAKYPPPCDDEIFCKGELLDTVQDAVLFMDSKHFVDMTLKNTPEETLRAFYKLKQSVPRDARLTQDQVRAFVDEHFDPPGSELEEWLPEDWKPKPEFLEKIHDGQLQEFAQQLHQLWKVLGRKVKDRVREYSNRYSLYYIPHGTIVPGGRFREFYYWDSYWVVKALLIGGMHETVKGMLRNFAEMQKTLGFIPNGGRKYYARRSQPPYFIPMVKEYVDFTGDLDFLKEIMDTMEQEYSFWQYQRSTLVTVNGKEHLVTIFNASTGGPRPESYREDKAWASVFDTDAEKDEFYAEVKSACESGWDFSTRWYKSYGHVGTNLTDIHTRNVAPVDLNSLMCYNAVLLSDMNQKLGRNAKAARYSEIARSRNETIQQVFWDNHDGIWYDFDIVKGERRKSFYLSNVHPLWTGCYGVEGGPDKSEMTRRVVDYLWTQGALDYKGGVPTSLVNSEEQWDYPNAWAPLQHILVEGLRLSPYPEAHDLARNLAQKWVYNNWKTFKMTKSMFEKYDTMSLGYPGHGGEYDVQIGFGWSNGVVLDFINTYADRLDSFDGESSGAKTALHSWNLVFLMITFFVILATRAPHHPSGDCKTMFS